jgi:NADH-quinone oxidoreductase subunit H
MKVLFIILIFKILIIIVPFLISVAFFTIAERKIMGSIQIRKGPNIVGYIGLLQPLADGLKLFIKENLLPNSSDELVFLVAPLMALILSILNWGVIPFSNGFFLSDLNLSVIFIFTISALNVYSLLFAGWGSNSKYSYLGAIRSVAQMISYEISFSFACLIIIIVVSSCNFSKIILLQKNIWFIVPFFPLFLIFYIIILAETNRHPFDLPEAESELVSGYNVEYSGIPFAQFFLGEYGNMLLMSIIGSIFFWGGWFFTSLVFFLPDSTVLGVKLCFGVIYFIISRAAFPRFRFDQLMELGWIFLLPLVLGYFLFFLGLVINFNILLS